MLVRAWFVGLMIVVPLSAAEPGSVEFFEAKIRPVLVEKCYSCHSAEAAKKNKLRGGLALDTAASVMTGGDTGPALVPGKAAESLLLKSLKYSDDLKMPPSGKLSDAVIADFEAWIAAGAKDPRTAEIGLKKQVGPSIEEGKKHWAYQPIPTKKPGETIDQLWTAKLQEQKLTPGVPATPAVWLRRVSFDLTGLPPTPEAITEFEQAFAKDAQMAREAVVDRLLASPAFGERWGRHWLDVARYADSVTLRGFVFPEAWRYRDYVITAFNQDKPFDRFLAEQIAGDLLTGTPEEKSQGRIATTFLMLGNTNLEEQDKKQLRMDVVDEQLDVITKGMLAQTVTCARCHDHKFDPIPTKDYYALAGIFRSVKALEDANVSKWIEMPLPAAEQDERTFAAAEKEIAALSAKLKALQAKKPAAKGALAIKDVPGIVVDETKAKIVGDWKASKNTGVYIGAGYVHDDNDRKGEKTLTFQPESAPTGRFEVLLAYSHSPSRAKEVPVTVFSADGEKLVKIDMQANPPINGRFVSLGEHRFEKDGQCYVIVSNEGTTGHVTADAVVFRSLEKTEQATTVDETKKIEAELKRLREIAAKRPRVMTVIEESQATDLKVHIRGSVHTLGELAPRGFLQVASTGPSPKLPANQSGRRELAAWITAQENPLTARVYANRAWHWLFGSGLVRSVDNFGLTGETPSNAALLDHLAQEFQTNGWSVKKLLRQITLSQAYATTSLTTPEQVKLDPDNRYFSHANRRRLEGEAMRDAMLQISGQLQAYKPGIPFAPTLASDYNYSKDQPLRSVYLPQFRNSPPEFLAQFDAADPSLVTGKRNTATVAPQALYMLHHPFPASQAEATAKRLLAQSLSTDDDRIMALYRTTLARPATPGEAAALRRMLASTPNATTAWTKIAHALFASADFRFVD
ncbi:MAG: DUF1553 domain-containing protein [Fimbriiglobus sp.]